MPGGRTALKQTALPLANPNPHPARRDKGSVCLCSDFSPGTNGTSAHSQISSACGSPWPPPSFARREKARTTSGTPPSAVNSSPNGSGSISKSIGNSVAERLLGFSMLRV
jgi:hypothetical protein